MEANRFVRLGALRRGRSVWFRYRLFPDGAGSCH